MDHPNIVKLIETYNEEKYLCLVFEYIPGGDLFDAIKLKGNFSENEVLKASKLMVDSIRYFH